MTIPRTATQRLEAIAPGALCFFLFITSAALAPSEARASDGYAQLWGGLAVANSTSANDTAQWGPGAQLGARVGITDFWSLTGGVEGSYHFESDDAPAGEVLGVFGGLRYNLDVFQYVPYLGLSIENFIRAPAANPDTSQSFVGGKLSVGVDWRYAREWSLGGVIELHAPIAEPDAFPIYSTLGINLAYHFRL